MTIALSDGPMKLTCIGSWEELWRSVDFHHCKLRKPSSCCLNRENLNPFKIPKKENVNLFDVLMCVSPFIYLAVRLWSLHSYTNVVAYKGHNFPVWDLDISPQCLYFATGSQDRTARLWNLEYTFPLRIFAGHLQDVDVSLWKST